MKLSTIISNYRKRYGLSLRAFADKCECSFQYIDKLEKEEIAKPSLAFVQKLATAMNISLDSLLREMDDTVVDIDLPISEPVMIMNVYSDLCCGNGLFVDDNVVTTVSVPTSMLPKGKKEFFGQYASGDSMIGYGINDGDLLVFSHEQCESGDVGCFCIDENVATCKKLMIVGNQIMLMPCNDKYEPILADPESFRCVGKLVLKICKVK